MFSAESCVLADQDPDQHREPEQDQRQDEEQDPAPASEDAAHAEPDDGREITTDTR